MKMAEHIASQDDEKDAQNLVNGCSLVDSLKTVDVTENLISNDEEKTMDEEGDGCSSSASSLTSTTISVELLSLEKAKRSVWNHFGFPTQSGKCIQKD